MTASRRLSANLPILVLCLMALALLATAAPAGAEEATITVTTDEFLYSPGESVLFEITVDSGDATLDGDLLLEVYDADIPSSAAAFQGETVYDTVIESGYSNTGRDSIQYEASISGMGLGSGGYPVRVSLWEDGEEVLTGETWLAVIKSTDEEPIDLLLLWSVGAPPERNAAGEFTGTNLVDRTSEEPRSPDTLLQHLEIAGSYPDIKTVYAIEPSLLDQLDDMSNGFDVRRDDDVEVFPDTSVEAAAAAETLESLKDLAASRNVEILSAPYAYTQLPLLAKEGWSDGNGQYRVGDDVLGRLLELPGDPAGVYAPGLNVTTDSLRYLAATGGEYAVLGGFTWSSVEGHTPEGTVSYRLRDVSGERITSFFASDIASYGLLGDPADPGAFFAALVNAYLEDEPLLIAASPVAEPAITAQQRDKVYSLLDGEEWINSITLNEAKEKYRPDTEPVTLLRYVDPTSGYVSSTYYDRLADVHGAYEDYRAAVDTHEPRLSELSKMIFTAESEYWAGEKALPGDANRGMEYLGEIERITGEEFRQLSVDVDTPWLQRTAPGNATVTINNESAHAFTVDMLIEGDGVEFPEGYEQRVRLEPGQSEFEVAYSADGWSGLKARISSGSTLIADDAASIHPVSGRAWIVIIVALLALLGGTAYYFIVIRAGG